MTGMFSTTMFFNTTAHSAASTANPSVKPEAARHAVEQVFPNETLAAGNMFHILIQPHAFQRSQQLFHLTKSAFLHAARPL